MKDEEVEKSRGNNICVWGGIAMRREESHFVDDSELSGEYSSIVHI